MASAVATDKLACNFLIKNYDHDPETTNAKVISADGGTTEIWFDLRDYDHVGFLVHAGALTGAGPTKLEIVASDSEDETDGSVTVVKDSGTIALNTLPEGAFEECSAEEVAQLAGSTGYDLRYVTARITCANAADEAQVIVVAHARRPRDAVTSATW
jgi:hypothetical protein